MRLPRLTPLVIDFARRNGGVITRNQVFNLGGTSHQITSLLRTGILIRIHAGVFVLGAFPLSHHVYVRAALAAVEPGSMASHRSAAWLYGLVDRPPQRPEVTAGAEHRVLKGVVLHRSNPLPASRPVQGLPCTEPARTLVDLAATATPSDIADAMDRALSKRLVRTRDLEAEVRRGRRRGTDALRRSLEERGHTDVPDPSVLESRMARLFSRFGLPPAKAEYVAGQDGQYHLDYSYPGPRVALELHSYTWHHSPEQMASDFARQRELVLDGWKVLVFTWKDVTRDPARVAAEIRQALGTGLARPEPAPRKTLADRS